MSAAWKCFHRSLYILVGPGPQSERLLRAYRLNLAHLHALDMPTEIREDFLHLQHHLAVLEEKAAGSPQPVAALAEERESISMTHAILRMYDLLARYQPLRASPEQKLSALEGK